MSVRDRAKERIKEILYPYIPQTGEEGDRRTSKMAHQILSIPELAIVDRELKLPLLTDAWIGKGWLKEVKE